MFVVLCISTNVSEKSGLPILGVEIFSPEDEGCVLHKCWCQSAKLCCTMFRNTLTLTLLGELQTLFKLFL